MEIIGCACWDCLFGGTYFFILFNLSSIFAEGFLAELCWVKYCLKHVGFTWCCYFLSPQAGCFFYSPPSRTLQSTTWSSCLAKRCSQSGRSWPRRPLAVCSLPSPWSRSSWWVQEESTFIQIGLLVSRVDGGLWGQLVPSQKPQRL